MTRLRGVLAGVLAPALLAGCAVVASPVGNGAFYTQVNGPVATGPATGAAKQGRACASNVLGLVAVGDASIAAAKRSGGITSVAAVDHDSLNVLGFYSRFCTVVSGE